MTALSDPHLWRWVAVVSAWAVVHSYLLYPGLLWLLTIGRRQPTPDPPASWPSVSLIIAAYNEADVLAAKLENSFAQFSAACAEFV